MVPFSCVPVFSILATFSSCSASAIDVDNSNDLTRSILRGAGAIESQVTTEESEFLEICRCLNNVADVRVCSRSPKNETVIHNGICYKNLGTMSKRSITTSTAISWDEAILSSPPAFFERKKYQGTQNIILASSGSERKLYLSTKSSVFICPKSIDLRLQELNIFNVSRIVIAPGSLKPRNSSIAIHFSDIQEKVVFPEGSFSVYVKTKRSNRNPKLIDQESTSTPPIEVKLGINSAANIEFKGGSLVAPIVYLKLSNIKNVLFGSKAVIPYAYPEASILDINNCHSVVLSPYTMNAGKFEAKYIEVLLMKEKAVEIADDSGAMAKVEHVTSMTIFGEGLTIGRGADIIFDNVTLASASVRSIQGASRGSLRRASFLHINGKQLSSVALCIKTETAVIFNIEMAGKDGQTGGCIEAQHVHGTDSSGTLLICDRLEPTKVICDDPKCEQCTHGSEETTATRGPPFPFHITNETFHDTLYEDSSSNYTVIATQTNTVSLEKATAGSGTNSSPTKSSTQDSLDKMYFSLSEKENEEPANDMELRDTPHYIIIIFLCVLIVLIFFAAYMVYKCCNCKKHDKYCLPQENRLSTFHNPRTITTPENLTDKNNRKINSNFDIHDEFSNYNSYRGQPIVTYLAHSNTLDVVNTRSSPECQVSSNKLDTNPIAVRSHQPNFVNHHDSPLGQQQCLSEDCYQYSDKEMRHCKQVFHGYLPNEEYLPSPDGYVQKLEMQMFNEDIHLSEDNSSQ